MKLSADIFILIRNSETLDRRHRQYSRGWECDDGAPEVNTQKESGTGL
jgi:hypothetical protein